MTEVTSIIYPFSKEKAAELLKGKVQYYIPPQRATLVPDNILIYLNEARGIIGYVSVVEEIYRNTATIYDMIYPEDNIKDRRDFWKRYRNKMKLSVFKVKDPVLFNRAIPLAELVPDRIGPRNGILYQGKIPEGCVYG